MKDYRLVPDNSGGVAVLLSDGLTGDSVLNGIVLSLTIRKGSWWYKVEFGLDWNDRAKLTARSEIVLREKIKDALKWMFRTGLLEAVEVETWKLRQGVLAYHVKATSKDKRVVEYENFVGVI